MAAVTAGVEREGRRERKRTEVARRGEDRSSAKGIAGAARRDGRGAGGSVREWARRRGGYAQIRTESPTPTMYSEPKPKHRHGEETDGRGGTGEGYRKYREIGCGESAVGADPSRARVGNII